ncbi:MAG: addiction module antitoxin RelB [Gammaproteobacteria bacterium PRO9]|nr:addiction module antitoxin RelB [Gammaproteobacteria bacterium PRO9]
MTTADISKLPVAEKLLLMERLWDALRAQADSGIVPAWHEDVLAERLRRLDAGNEPTSSWAEAKERIRSRTKVD